MKRITVLGSTGSIGTNCLNVVESQQSEFQVNYLTSYQNIQLLFEQAVKFRPKAVAIFQEEIATDYLPRFKKIGVELYTGFEGILEISRKDDIDIFVNALVGAVGLQPTLNAIRKNVRIALANKETLVIGGQFVGGGDVYLGNDQHMHGRLRIDVTKSQYIIIFKHHIRLNLTGYHFAE